MKRMKTQAYKRKMAHQQKWKLYPLQKIIHTGLSQQCWKQLSVTLIFQSKVDRNKIKKIIEAREEMIEPFFYTTQEIINQELYCFHRALTDFQNMIRQPFVNFMNCVIPTIVYPENGIIEKKYTKEDQETIDMHTQAIKELTEQFICDYKQQNPRYEFIINKINSTRT